MDYKKVADVERNRLIVGTKQILRAIEEDVLDTVIVATDADHFIKDTILSALNDRNVELVYAPSKEELGMLCGIKVSAASCGIIKAN